MKDIRGPGIAPEAFRVEGHCCGIRLPVLKTLTEQGLCFGITPQVRAELIATGMRLPDDVGAQPEPGSRQEPTGRTPGNR